MNYVNNILSVYQRATPTEIEQGRNWYPDAHKVCAHLTPNEPRIAAGVIAALSPQMHWNQNVKLACSCIRSKRFRGTFKTNVRKAQKIFEGENPEQILATKGYYKTLKFYRCIYSAGTCSDAVIDRHAAAIALGRSLTLAEQSKIRYRFYLELEQAYRTAATLMGIATSEMQAITWVTWRREKRA